MPHSGFLVSSEPPGGCFCAAGSSPVSQRAGGWPLGWQQQQRGGEAGGPQGTGAPSAGNEVTRSPHLRAQVSGGPARPGSPCARPWAPPRVGGRPPYPGGDGAGRLRGRTDGRTETPCGPLGRGEARRGEARAAPVSPGRFRTGQATVAGRERWRRRGTSVRARPGPAPRRGLGPHRSRRECRGRIQVSPSPPRPRPGFPWERDGVYLCRTWASPRPARGPVGVPGSLRPWTAASIPGLACACTVPWFFSIVSC
jgi:hypothetical protein